MFSLLYIITDWCIKEKDCEIRDYVFSDKELTIESRKLVDKIAITMLYNEIDNAIIINCILKPVSYTHLGIQGIKDLMIIFGNFVSIEENHSEYFKCIVRRSVMAMPHFL